jgi:hypothetical protein
MTVHCWSWLYYRLFYSNLVFGLLRLLFLRGLGLFAMGAFVLHNYVDLNIGLTLTMQQAIVYFVEWTIVGLVVGLIYPAAQAFPR